MRRGNDPDAADGLHPLVAAYVQHQGAPDTELAWRMLWIKSALYIALETRGHEARPGGAVVNGEQFSFWLYEAERRTRVPLKPKEWGYRAGEGITKQVMVPSGEPTLVVQPDVSRHGGGERRWADRPGRRLENQVERIVTRFEIITRQMAESRLRSEEWERQREIDLRRAAKRLLRDEEEEARPTMLRELADDWYEAARLRAFLDALEARLASHPSPGAMAKWLAWARSHAGTLDPLVGDGLAGLADHAEILDAPIDEERHPNEQEWRYMGLLEDYL